MDAALADPTLHSTLVGVLSNGIYTILSHVGRAAKRGLYDGHAGTLDSDISTILRTAVARESEVVSWTAPPRIEEVCLFLGSPEVEAIVRQTFSATLCYGKEAGALESIHKAFISQFALCVGAEESFLAPKGERLFDVITSACLRALDAAVQDGLLSAHDTKSAYEHRLLLDELTAVQRVLSLLIGQQRPDLSAILDFEQKYRLQVADRHKHIIPPYVDALKRIPINQLYVSPAFMPLCTAGDPMEGLTSQALLECSYRVVVVGHPGGGKSTFAQKLCHDLATKYDDRILGGRRVTPVLVILREYGSEKKNRKCSILQHIETVASSKYQVPLVEGAFEYLLLNGRLAVVFDGLDELLDTSYRQEIAGDVESFCTLYPSVPVIVTSRQVGYDQAPLDDERFEVFRLVDFNSEQVEEYVSNWFDIDFDLSHDQRIEKARSFLTESEIVSDLRANPLMLGLLCNIYRGENYIPRNRPDVYEKCALMLFEQWDRRRGILTPLPFEAHVRPTMMHLAHWIYSDATLQSGVSEETLVKVTKEYLHPRRFEDPDDAEQAAREFIGFCRGRAWVFTDIGTKRQGERLYQFTHRTFLEYFTACHLVRTHETVGALTSVLLPRVAKQEWDVVAQLAFQIKNRYSEDAGDGLINSLVLEAGVCGASDSRNLLSFAARCLQFMTPSPKVVRSVSAACLDQCMNLMTRSMPKGGRGTLSEESELADNATALIGPLLAAAPENRPTVTDHLEKALVTSIDTCEGRKFRVAWELGLHLPRTLAPSQNPSHLHEYWGGVSDRIYAACAGKLLAHCPSSLPLCMEAVRRRTVKLSEVVEWHGLGRLFTPGRLRIFSRLHLLSIADRCAVEVFSPKKNVVLTAGRDLSDLGRALLASPPPWAARTSLGYDVFVDSMIADATRGWREDQLSFLDSDARFALLVATCIRAERQLPAGDSRYVLQRIFRPVHPILRAAQPLLEARLMRPISYAMSCEFQEQLENLGLDEKQVVVALQWALGELDFVG